MGKRQELDLEQLRKERSDGSTLKEIAKKHKTSISTISRRLSSKTAEALPVDGEVLDFGTELPMVIYKESKQLPFLTEAALQLGGSYAIPEPERYEDFAETYQNVVWVYASIYAIANSLVRIPLYLFRRVKSDKTPNISGQHEGDPAPSNEMGEEREVVEGHPAMKLLTHPNNDDGWEDLLEKTVISLELCGDAYIEIVSGKLNEVDIPEELYYINPAHMKIVANKNLKGIDHYEFEVTDSLGTLHKEEFDPDEVIHIKYHNPLDYWYGQGSALAASRNILLEQYLQRFCQRYFENDASPRGVLMTEQVINKDQAEEILAKWRHKYGGVDNAHKIALLPMGLKYEKIGSTLQELEMDSLNTDNKTKIMATFGVNDAVLGLDQNMPRDVYRASMRIFYENVLMPKARRIQNALTRKLLPMFGGDDDYEYYFEFDFSEVTAEPYDVKMNRYEKLFALGVVTPNEIAADLTGMTHDSEEANMLYVNKSYVPIDQAGQNQTNMSDEIDSKTKELKGIAERLTAIEDRLQSIERK